MYVLLDEDNNLIFVSDDAEELKIYVDNNFPIIGAKWEKYVKKTYDGFHSEESWERVYIGEKVFRAVDFRVKYVRRFYSKTN